MTMRFFTMLMVVTLLMGSAWFILHRGNRALETQLNQLAADGQLRKSIPIQYRSPTAPTNTLQSHPRDHVDDQSVGETIPTQSQEPIVITANLSDLAGELGEIFQRINTLEEDLGEVAELKVAMELMGKLPEINGAFQFHKESLKTLEGQSEIQAGALAATASLDAESATHLYEMILQEKQQAQTQGLLSSDPDQTEQTDDLNLARNEFDQVAGSRITAVLPADKRAVAEHFLNRWKISLTVAEGMARMMDSK